MKTDRAVTQPSGVPGVLKLITDTGFLTKLDDCGDLAAFGEAVLETG